MARNAHARTQSHQGHRKSISNTLSEHTRESKTKTKLNRKKYSKMRMNSEELERRRSRADSLLLSSNRFGYLSTKENLPRFIRERPCYPPTPAILTDIWVRKKRKEIPQYRSVRVLKPVEIDTVSFYSSKAPKLRRGPDIDSFGEIIPHSMLNDSDRHLIPTLIPVSSAEEFCRRKREDEINPVFTPAPALTVWNNTLTDRQVQRHHILAVTGKKWSEDLMMSETNTYKNCGSRYKDAWTDILEKEYPKEVTRTKMPLDAMFKNHVWMGDELTGLKCTRKRSDIDSISKIEYCGIPDNIKIEKGVPPYELRNFSWNGRRPDLSVLDVKGERLRNPVLEFNIQAASPENSDDSPKKHKLVDTPEIPSLTLNGNHYKWIDDVEEKFVTPITQVIMIGHPGEKVTENLRVTNDGTTVVFLYWVKQLKKTDVFNLGHNQIQKIFMYAKDTGLLPGDSIDIPIFFESSTSGIFTTVCRLMTQPVLCNGEPIYLHLWGITQPSDSKKEDIEYIKERLAYNQSVLIAEYIIDKIFLCIPIPIYYEYRPESALLKISERHNLDTIFDKANRGWYYHSFFFNMLKDSAHKAIRILDDEKFPNRNYTHELGDIPHHMLLIPKLIEDINHLPDTSEKDSIMSKFNRAVTKMSFSVQHPAEYPFKYTFCHDLLAKLAEDLMAASFCIKIVMVKDYAEKMKLEMKLARKKRVVSCQQTDKPESPPSGRRTTPTKKKTNRKKDTKVVVNDIIQNRCKHKMYTTVYQLLVTLSEKLEEGLEFLDSTRPLIDRLRVDDPTKTMFRKIQSELLLQEKCISPNKIL